MIENPEAYRPWSPVKTNPGYMGEEDLLNYERQGGP